MNKEKRWPIVAAGLAFDLSHSYAVPIFASVALNLIGALVIAATGKDRQPAPGAAKAAGG